MAPICCSERRLFGAPSQTPVAVETSAKRSHILSPDIILVLLSRQQPGTEDQRYLRYGYYYFLSKSTSARLYVQANASGVGRLVGKTPGNGNNGGTAYLLRDISYLVVLVRRPMERVHVEHPSSGLAEPAIAAAAEAAAPDPPLPRQGLGRASPAPVAPPVGDNVVQTAGQGILALRDQVRLAHLRATALGARGGG